MIWTVLLLVLLVHRFVKGTFDYEKVTRMRMVIIPLYSLVMMILTVHTGFTTEKLKLAVILFLVGAVIGIFQASQVRVKNTGEFDRFRRPVIEVKRDLAYLVGWIAIFIICVGVEAFEGASFGHEDIFHELMIEIMRDLSVITLFFNKTAWSTWVLNVASSFAYEICVFTKYPIVRQAVGKRQNQ